MQIKSNFKDYYDYVPHMYGDGGDPKVTYVRTRIAEMETFYGTKQPHDYPFTVRFTDVISLPDLNVRGSDYVINSAWLVIAGKYYPMIRTQLKDITQCSLFKDELDGFYVITKDHPLYIQFTRPYDWLYSGFEPFEQDKQYKGLVELSKLIGHPVFVITDTGYNISISRKCPHLAKHGVHNIIPAEQMYQDLYYFLGNVIQPSPDMMPEQKPPMTDKERILSHGFDLKKSFRHRKG